MPDQPRHRRRGKQPAAPATRQEPAQGSGRPAASAASATKSDYLHRAADCYLRAGELTEAARCLSAISTPLQQSRAADLYLRAGEYGLAALAYADAGRAEAAAWTHVHYLGETAAARAILQENPVPNVPPLVVSHAIDPWPRADSPWGVRVRQVGQRLAGHQVSGTDPAEGTSARDGLTALIERVLSDAFGYSGMTAALAEVRQLTADTVAARDLPAAYAARELGRLLADLQARHTDLDDRVRQRGQEDWNRTLAQRQVYARCDVADGSAQDHALEVLAATQRVLADTSNRHHAERTETWGVAIADAMRRYDQAALIFAAAVRGRRPGAAKRWQEWSARVLRADAPIAADLGQA
jgi:hypothetical protein